MGQTSTLWAYVFLIIGPCALVYSIFSIVQTRGFIRRCTEVPGEVIRLEQSEDRGRYGYTYAPVFTFTTLEGMKYTVTSDVGSSPSDFSIGDSVRVRYDSANPENARIHSFFQTWGLAVISGAISVGFIGFGAKLLGLLHLVK